MKKNTVFSERNFIVACSYIKSLPDFIRCNITTPFFKKGSKENKLQEKGEAAGR